MPAFRRPLALACLCVLTDTPVRGDFFYVDFGDITALRFNGDAAMSTCDGYGGAYAYAANATPPGLGSDDAVDGGAGAGGVGAVVYEEGTTTRSTRGSSTTLVDARGGSAAAARDATFPSRDAFGPAPNVSCAPRVRLTPARPYKAGSLARLESEAVLDGWETGFTFQLSDPSRACTIVKDAAFGTANHRTCTTAGGDGFAFVVHGDAAGSAALGGGGGGLGYAGLHNALAVEFDAWYNTGTGANDVPWDHVALQAAPPSDGAGGAGSPTVTSGANSSLSGAPLRVALADGAVHTARVAYYPYLRHDWVTRFVASPLVRAWGLLATTGDNRALGTLAVWVDARDASTGELLGAAPRPAGRDETPPTLAVPLNLNVLLHLPADEAFLSFTSATGSAWEIHDILSWYWCSRVDCPLELPLQQEAVVRYWNATGPQLPSDGGTEDAQPPLPSASPAPPATASVSASASASGSMSASASASASVSAEATPSTLNSVAGSQRSTASVGSETATAAASGSASGSVSGSPSPSVSASGSESPSASASASVTTPESLADQ